MLSITKDEFLKIYKDLPICDSVDLFYAKPVSDIEVLSVFLPSKLWRLNNCYTIVNKHGQRVRFRMNKAQHIVYAQSLRHPRVIILKSRQQGISTFWLVNFFDDLICRRDLSIGLMAQGTDEAETLLERTKLLWDTLDPNIKAYLNLAICKDNTKEFSLTNGSKIFIRTSFRSATLQRLHVSEMGKIANKFPDKAQETKTGTLQALAQGNVGAIESTAEGDNLFKTMWDTAVLNQHNRTPKDFLPIFLSWVDDPDCNIEQDQVISSKQKEYFEEVEAALGIKLTRTQKNFWVVQYRELGEKIYQEYPTTPVEAFMATKNGSYYAKLFFSLVVELKRLLPQGKLYDKNLAVQVAVDLGMNDTNVLTVFQTYKEQFRIISEFYDNGQEIEYYVNWMREQPWFDNLTHLILPHDAEVTELTSGLTRKERFEELLPSHVEITVLPKQGVSEGIEQVRQIMKLLWIDEACEYLQSCFINYRKEWDEKWERFRDKPNHDEYSNGADSIRYMAMGAKRETLYKPGSNHTSGRKRRTGGHDV